MFSHFSYRIATGGHFLYNPLGAYTRGQWSLFIGLACHFPQICSDLRGQKKLYTDMHSSNSYRSQIQPPATRKIPGNETKQEDKDEEGHK